MAYSAPFGPSRPCAGVPYSEDEILAHEPDRLGRPQARLHRHEHEAVIGPPGPRVAIRSMYQGIDLRVGEKRNQGTHVVLVRDRQLALDLRGVRRRFEGREVKEGMDRGGSPIATAKADAAPPQLGRPSWSDPRQDGEWTYLAGRLREVGVGVEREDGQQVTQGDACDRASESEMGDEPGHLRPRDRPETFSW